MSERSMARKLQNENTCFKKLLEEERRQRYLSIIGAGYMPQHEIAVILGFADDKNLFRAKRKWKDLSD
jgi:AraC-like DNA-binding protein